MVNVLATRQKSRSTVRQDGKNGNVIMKPTTVSNKQRLRQGETERLTEE